MFNRKKYIIIQLKLNNFKLNYGINLIIKRILMYVIYYYYLDRCKLIQCTIPLTRRENEGK